MTILPTASPFPAPTFNFPTPASASDPLFGVNPYSTQNRYVDSFVDSSLGLPDLAARAAARNQLISQAQVAMVNQAGIPLDSNPSEWTPDQAATQTDQAIAKIATVNPELAQQLADQRSGQESDGGGLWNAIKDAVGTVISPALSIGGTILDYVGRTANVVPNIAFDIANGGDFNMAGDIGGALSGNTRHNWNSVFQEMGWEGGGFTGFLRATMGLAGDIATDPLTWVIPTGAGVHVSEAAAKAGAEVATKSPTMLALATERLGAGATQEAAAAHLTGLFDTLTTGLKKAGFKYADDAAERGQALVGRMVGDADRALAADMFDAVNQMYSVVGSRSLGKFVRKGGELTLASGRTISAAETKTLMEAAVKGGAGAARSSTAWADARAFASVMGGTRFKMAIPWTQLRYISPAIPGTWGFTIDNLGRFFAGQSGMNRMVGAIAEGRNGATWDTLNTWMQKGWSALRNEQPDVVDLLRGRGKNLGSMLYTASEGVGAMTAHLSKGARAWRTGYGGYWAHKGAQEIQNYVNKFLHDIESIEVDGKIYTKENFLRDTEAYLGISLRKSRNTATPEQMDTMVRYLDYFPHDLDVTQPAAIDGWFWEHGSVYVPERGVVPAKVAQEEGGDVLALAQARLKNMHDTANQLNAAQRTQLQRMGKIWDNARSEAAKKDAVMNDVRMGYEEANRLHPGDITRWQGAGMNPGLQQRWFVEPDNATAAAYLRTHGVGEMHMTPGDDAMGVHLTTRPTHPDAVEVAPRGRHFVVVDRTTDAVTTDEQLLADAARGADEAGRQATVATDAIGGMNVDATQQLVAKESTKTRAELIRDDLKVRHGGSQGVIYKESDGTIRATIFDWNDVKVIDDKAPQLVAQRGYFHRTFAQDMKEWLRGTLSPTGRTVLVEAPHLETYLRRETFGMTIDEAEDHVRRVLAERYGEEAVQSLPRSVWNRDVLGVHEQYLQWTAQGITAEMVGALSERMRVLGDLTPALFSKGVRDQVYEWALSPAMLRALKSTDTATTRAILKAQERVARMTDELQRNQAKQADRLGRLFVDLEETLQYGLESPDRLTSAIRGYGASAADAQIKVQAALARIAERQTRVRDDMALWGKAEAQVSADPLMGHPGKLDPLSIEDLGEGEQLIRGYNGRLDGVTPDEAVKDVNPEELSNGGLHVGTYQQAKDRVDTLVGLDERVRRDGTIGTPTVGYRDDPSSWPTVEGTSTMPNPSRGPGETMESHQHRLMDGGQFPTRDIKERAEVDQFGAMALQKAEGGSKNTDMAALRADIRANGVQEPITIRINEDGSWSQLSGKHRLDAADAEGIDSVPVKWVGEDGIEVDPPPMGSGATPVEPDLFYEDLIHPVEVRGRFHGAAEGEPIVGEADMGPLSGSGRGATPEKTATRSQYKEQGYDGLIYQNAAENGAPPGALGQSVVVFDPQDHIFDARGPQIMRTYADEGSLYVDPATGSVFTKAGNWAKGGRFKKLRNIDELKRELDQLGVDHADFERALRGIREGEAVGGQVFEGELNKGVIEATGRVGSNLGRIAEREQAMGFAAGRKYGRLRRDALLAVQEMNRSIAEFKQVRAQLKPALVKVDTADLAGYTALKIPGLEGLAMPAYIAEEFHSLVDQYGVGAIRQDWRRYVLGPWKRWATYRWPGFHVRNFFGAYFNNWLGGVSDAHYTFAWRVARAREGVEKWVKPVSLEEFDNFELARAFGKSARGKVTYADVSEMMSEMGIGHANVMAVYGIDGAIEATDEAFRAVGKKNPSLARKAARKYDDAMRYAGTSVEDFHRYAAFARGMQTSAGDRMAARAFVMMRHGDYAELTAAEDFIRDLVPFYKWMRTNVPYQIRMLAENPAMLTLPDKLKSYAYDVQGIDRRQAELQQPDYMKQTFAVPIPDWVPLVGSKGPDQLKFAMFDLPYSDLYNGLQDYMSSALPIVRNVFESYGFKQTLFSGKPLTGKYEKLNGVMALPGVSNLLEAVGVAKRGADGELYVQDKMQNVLMAWPVYSRFRNFVEGDPDRAAGRLGAVFSMIGGVGIREGDFTNAELDFFYNEVQPLLEQYRSLGITMPTVDEMQSAQVGAQLGLSDAQTEPIDQLFPTGQVA